MKIGILKYFLLFSVFTWSTIQAAPVAVSTDWLAKHLNDDKIAVIDMSSNETQYQRFHLPNAIYLPYHALIQQRKKDRIPVRLDSDKFIALLGMLGITQDRHVVIYDDLGGLNAGRLFWELERLGHPDVSVLDGGLVKWILEGRKVTNTPVTPRPAKYIAKGTGRDNEADLEEIDQVLEKKTALILDVRSLEEYVGDEKRRSGGHVPGARWWEWTNSVDFENEFKWKKSAVLNKSLADLGIDKSRSLILYCQSGHRASQAYLTLRNLGYEKVKVYGNSMNEYERYRKSSLKRGNAP